MVPLLFPENYDWQTSDLPSIEPLIITFFRELSFISLFGSFLFFFFYHFFLSWKTLEMSSPKTFFSHYVCTQVIPCPYLIQHKLWQKEQKLNPMINICWHLILFCLNMQLIGKHSDAGQDWRQEEKGMIEDETAGSYHSMDGIELDGKLNGHEFE